ncbi:uncharacterized protein BP01DRAFT_141794 [Aspergillus saccharolyticus JOP 1030-1]|uniref:Uncharacterized protein n=1 Tax=Aspergillus saccharolyticus JOP 1030-1 TaxID=1450539 RepID=A0A318ZBN4_9EURO|nr:hypothetical protein BP01DRAFT_141794 [Aspergillus saccharolyticus JOP 1030-1]PYH42113.1 hypothetical protein BP01DRAFT_141794 [Aspergillus saccharolyticus JOP 1030-1]
MVRAQLGSAWVRLRCLRKNSRLSGYRASLISTVPHISSLPLLPLLLFFLLTRDNLHSSDTVLKQATLSTWADRICLVHSSLAI